MSDTAYPKFCWGCGKPLKTGQKFCTFCGKQIVKNNNDDSGAPTQIITKQEEIPLPKDRYGQYGQIKPNQVQSSSTATYGNPNITPIPPKNTQFSSNPLNSPMTQNSQNFQIQSKAQTPLNPPIPTNNQEVLQAISRLEQKLEQSIRQELNTKLGTFEERFNALELSTSTLTTQFSNSLESIQESVKKLEYKVNGLNMENRIVDMEKTVESLHIEGNLEAMTTEIKRLEAKIEATPTKYDLQQFKEEMETSLDAKTPEISPQAIGDLATKISELEEEVQNARIGDRLVVLNDAINKKIQMVNSNLEDKINLIEKKIGNQVNQMGTSVGDLVPALLKLTEKVNNLNAQEPITNQTSHIEAEHEFNQNFELPPFPGVDAIRENVDSITASLDSLKENPFKKEVKEIGTLLDESDNSSAHKSGETEESKKKLISE